MLCYGKACSSQSPPPEECPHPVAGTESAVPFAGVESARAAVGVAVVLRALRSACRVVPEPVKRQSGIRARRKAMLPSGCQYVAERLSREACIYTRMRIYIYTYVCVCASSKPSRLAHIYIYMCVCVCASSKPSRLLHQKSDPEEQKISKTRCRQGYST